MNKSVHEQIFQGGNKKSQVTNGVSSNERASWQQHLATSWEYRRESISCCVTFAQYTSLLEFAVPSLEFHYVLWFFYILLNKTPWDKNSFGSRMFRVINGLQERIKLVNRGSTVLIYTRLYLIIQTTASTSTANRILPIQTTSLTKQECERYITLQAEIN
jgi:hypothetical protein